MKRLLFHHFEKAVLALSALFLLAAMKPLLARPVELAAEEKIVEENEALERHMRTFTPDVPPVPDDLSKLRASVTVGEPVEAFPGWLIWRRPNLACEVIDHTPRKPRSKHCAPSIDVTVTHGSATIAFTHDTENECVVTGYTIRRTDEKGATVVVGTAREEGKITDDKVEERATYTYTVVEAADGPPGWVPLELKDVELSASKKATLPREWIVHPSREVTRDDLMKQPVSVKLYVYRWKDGQWHRQELYSVGIGAKANGKKTARCDFSSGAELLEIANEKGVTTIKLRWPSGRVESVSSADTYEGVKRPGD